MFHRFFNYLWYSKNPFAGLLWPLSWVFRRLILWRRKKLVNEIAQQSPIKTPIIVVGNISVGGTGKTPLTLWLIEQLIEHGLRPGVVSRGYGAVAPYYPYPVHFSDKASTVGDEPLMIHLRSRVPVVVDPDRVAAVHHLMQNTNVDVVISDDGLQHYRLPRCVELAVIDGSRGVGNGMLLPAGPLREPVTRLTEVDAVVVNGAINEPLKALFSDPIYETVRRFQMNVEAGEPVELNAESRLHMPALHQVVVQSVTGIGNPQRFFSTLDSNGYQHSPLSFPDHHRYTPEEIARLEESLILTTEKDAVKLREFPSLRGAYIPINARLQDGLIDVILARIKAFKAQYT